MVASNFVGTGAILFGYTAVTLSVMKIGFSVATNSPADTGVILSVQGIGCDAAVKDACKC